MPISARNRIKGTVESIETGAVNAVVHLRAASGERVTATISLDAVKELGLAAGTEATAIVKATDVLVGIGDAKLSARNQFPGEVVNIETGAVNDIVAIKTEGGDTFSATITRDAVEELGLAVGVKAKAIVKATSVLIEV